MAVEIRSVANGFIVFTSGFGPGYAQQGMRESDTYVFPTLALVMEFLEKHFKKENEG